MATNEFIPLETSNLQTDTHGQVWNRNLANGLQGL